MAVDPGWLAAQLTEFTDHLDTARHTSNSAMEAVAATGQQLHQQVSETSMVANRASNRCAESRHALQQHHERVEQVAAEVDAAAQEARVAAEYAVELPQLVDRERARHEQLHRRVAATLRQVEGQLHVAPPNERAALAQQHAQLQASLAKHETALHLVREAGGITALTSHDATSAQTSAEQSTSALEDSQAAAHRADQASTEATTWSEQAKESVQHAADAAAHATTHGQAMSGHCESTARHCTAATDDLLRAADQLRDLDGGL